MRTEQIWTRSTDLQGNKETTKVKSEPWNFKTYISDISLFYPTELFFYLCPLDPYSRGFHLSSRSKSYYTQQRVIKTFDRMWKYQQEESALGNHIGNGGAQSTGEPALLLAAGELLYYVRRTTPQCSILTIAMQCIVFSGELLVLVDVSRLLELWQPTMYCWRTCSG